MPREFGRNRRVADQVQREIAAMVQVELDPGKHGLVTISGADVSPDLKQAKVFFTCIGGRLRPEELERCLNDQAAHYRHRLASALTMRSVPRLQFCYDASVERGSRIHSLLESLHRDDK
ncbi:MAG: 30S ribosome-binding factor RbfA [Gammaproteobacteria bacterium]|nr:30S ribosome-binding factor RbfA [Gammaproteobacteria bacterium]